MAISDITNDESGSSIRSKINNSFSWVNKIIDHSVTGITPAHYDSLQACINAASAGETIMLTSDISFEGVTINKRLNFFGVGREYTTVSGSFTVEDTGGNSTFQNCKFSSPSGAHQITVDGVGGLNFRDCEAAPGAGKIFMEWDHTEGAGGSPQIMEFMQCKITNGKLLKTIGTGVTYIIHVKESSLFTFSEADTIDAASGGYCELAIYNTLVNINNADLSVRNNFILRFRAACTIDDNTTDVAWRDNNGTGMDTLEISGNTTMAFNSVGRFLDQSPIFTGTGVPGTQNSFQTVPSGILFTFDPDLCDEVFLTGTATPLTATQSWVIASGAGKYEGQKCVITVLGSIDTQGNTVAVFGRNLTPASQEMQGLKVTMVYDGTNWVCSYSDLA